VIVSDKNGKSMNIKMFLLLTSVSLYSDYTQAMRSPDRLKEVHSLLREKISLYANEQKDDQEPVCTRLKKYITENWARARKLLEENSDIQVAASIIRNHFLIYQDMYPKIRLSALFVLTKAKRDETDLLQHYLDLKRSDKAIEILRRKYFFYSHKINPDLKNKKLEKLAEPPFKKAYNTYCDFFINHNHSMMLRYIHMVLAMAKSKKTIPGTILADFHLIAAEIYKEKDETDQMYSWLHVSVKHYNKARKLLKTYLKNSKFETIIDTRAIEQFFESTFEVGNYLLDYVNQHHSDKINKIEKRNYKLKKKAERAITYYKSITEYPRKKLTGTMAYIKVASLINVANAYDYIIAEKPNLVLDNYKQAIAMAKQYRVSIDQERGKGTTSELIEMAKQNISLLEK